MDNTCIPQKINFKARISTRYLDSENPYSPAKYARYWSQNDADVRRVLTCGLPWSPMVFSDGHRRKDSFVVSELLVLDVDKNTTLEEAKQFTVDNRLQCVFGLTKSHQKPKRSGKVIEEPCDRFRIVLFAAEPCPDRENLVYTYQRYIKQFGADETCKDLARFYWPCKSLFYWQGGRKIEWLAKPKHIAQEEIARQLAIYKRRAYQESGQCPKFLQRILTEGVSSDRHKTCYTVANYLFEYGVAKSASECFEILNNSFFATIDDEKYLRRTAYGAAKKQGL